MHDTANLKRLLLLAAALAAVLGLEELELLKRPNDLIAERRMAFAPRPASGDIAFLAIDKKSLDRVGIWPWPREIHAQIIDGLVAADAAEIAIDIDFSVASRSQGDRALAQALAAAGNSVILPAFVQLNSADRDDGSVGHNTPLPAFADHAWIGSVSFAADPDGVVRRFPWGLDIGGNAMPSVAAMLAGTVGSVGVTVPINFAVDPATVPTFPVIDLLEGRIGAAELAGRSVIVGAHALELRDHFTVPVHGVISGAMLQVLAAETISQDIAPVPVRAGALLAAVALLVGLAAFGPLRGGLRTRLAAFAALALAIEVAGFLAQTRLDVVLPTAGVHLVLLVAGVVLGFEELDLRGWMLRVARAAASNTQLVLERIIADSSDIVLVADQHGEILEMSRCARGFFGPREGSPGRLVDIMPAAMAAEAHEAMDTLRDGGWRPGEHREMTFGAGDAARILEYSVTPSRLAGPRRRAGASGDSFVACITARDVTERRRHQARLDYLSRFDEATGAMRREELLARLAAALDDWSDPDLGCAVFVLKLHGFKRVNNSLGRRVGDLLLASVVQRLEGCDPRCSAPARLRGDTFAVFSRCGLEASAAAALAEALAALVGTPFELEGSTARVGVQIGLSRSDPAAPRDAAVLLSEAEVALDEARKAGCNTIMSFDPASSARQERARELERDLWGAIERDELFLLYQPQVGIAGMRLVGAEALVRWRHPRLGLVSPVEFIEIAEGNGFIDELGRWVLGKACADAARWPAALDVAVNVAPAQFIRGDVLGEVRRALVASGLPASRLTLEITESSFLSPTAEFLELLADIRLLGISLALDDFGTGFSSLGYLARFPLDKIKVDRMFVQRIGREAASAAILKSVRLLSDELGFRMVCEGIETPEQLAYLRALGCDDVQGYLFGKPLPEAEFLAMWREGEPLVVPSAA